MIIEVGNVLCRVLSATTEESEWVQRYLSFEDASFHGKGKGRRISMYSTIKSTFPGGLLPLVLEAGARDNVKVEQLDKRVPRLMRDAQADLAWLRPYQLDAVDACINNKRGIIRAPTGSGKGDMIVGVTKALPGRWLFLVHRENLVDQQAKRYKRLTGLAPHIVKPYWDGGGKAWNLLPGLNLMTLQLLASGIRRDKSMVDAALADVDGLMIDECHVAPADIYFNAIQRCPAEYRLGFSGTPLDRTDNRSLMAIAALGRVIYSIKASTLIEAGVLAAPRITMVQVHQKLTYKAGPSRSSRGPQAFHKIYEELITTSVERNTAIVELAKIATKPCMIFVKQIKHGRDVQQLLDKAGLATEFVWGNTSPEARAAAIERLERHDADVMIASVVLQEGVDIPSLESVIIGSGGKSVIATLQRIGRGMRTDNGRKASFDVYDILDMGSPMMERHSRKRMNTYVREGYQTIIQAQDGTTTGYQPKLRTRREKRDRLR